MKALVKYEKGSGNAEIRNISEPIPGPDEVKCRVVKAGICGSDMHVYHGTMNSVPPVVMGHEFIGYITEVGENVKQYHAGQRVSAEIGHEVCGVCDYCRAGLPNMCIDRKSMGYVYDGVFAEYVIIPARDIVLVPDDIDSVEAVLLEPLACACRACFDFADIKAGNVVVIEGAGPMAQMISQVCKAFGTVVVITETQAGAKRMDMAVKLGADHGVNVDEGAEKLEELVMSLTRGYGADIVFECSGSDNAINTGLKLLKKGGQFVQFAVGTQLSKVDWVNIINKELHVSGAMSSVRRNWIQAIDLLKEGKIDLKPIGDSLFKLDDWKKAFELYESRKAYKVSFDISPDKFEE